MPVNFPFWRWRLGARSFCQRLSPRVLSAYCITLASAAYRDMSLANTVKSNGPRAEPWKTLMVLGSGGETRTVPVLSRSDTLCVWPARYASNHVVSMPYKRSFTAEYETDSFERIQSSPSPLAGNPDPVQSGLVGQKPIQSNPICLVRTVKVFVYCVKCIHRYTYSFVNFLHGYVGIDFAARNPSKRYMFYENNNLSSNTK